MKANNGSDARICDPLGKWKTGWLNNPATRSFISISLDYFFLAAFLLLFQAVASNITGVPMKRDA